MDKLVLDASIVLKWFFKEKNSLKALRIQKKLKDGKIKIWVPQIFFFEVINVIKTKSISTAQDVDLATQILFELPFINQKTNQELLEKANFYAQKFDLSIYDAAYIATANINQAVLIAADEKMTKKVNLKFVKTL